MPTSVEVTDEASAIRIPTAANDMDNYVVGLGVDLTTMSPVPHPNPEQGDLPGKVMCSPVILIGPHALRQT